MKILKKENLFHWRKVIFDYSKSHYTWQKLPVILQEQYIMFAPIHRWYFLNYFLLCLLKDKYSYEGHIFFYNTRQKFWSFSQHNDLFSASCLFFIGLYVPENSSYWFIVSFFNNWKAWILDNCALMKIYDLIL